MNKYGFFLEYLCWNSVCVQLTLSEKKADLARTQRLNESINNVGVLITDLHFTLVLQQIQEVVESPFILVSQSMVLLLAAKDLG